MAAPPAMLAISSRIPPSQYRSPVTNTKPMVAAAPRKAAPASSGFLRGARSAMAPMTGSTKTVRNTDSEMTYG